MFIVLKKAFDTINHILVSTLEQYGIRGTTLTWVKSYLKQQFVKIEQFQSECLNIVCGVPQGSVLGPKLLILYINGTCKVSSMLSILRLILFADDTNVLDSGENLHLLHSITSEFIKIKSWFMTFINNKQKCPDCIKFRGC